MPAGWLIAVSGLMGSGKTTLARGLAAKLRWQYVPEFQRATQLLPDLFKNPSRWAFEIQTAFLVNKALQLREALSSRTGVVLDRTIYEDADIFAEYFHRHDHIDRRSYETYRDLAKHFFEDLPPPDALVLCRCPIEIAKARIVSREKALQPNYPEHHVEDIAAMYDDWSKSYVRSDMYSFDSAKYDSRRIGVIEDVARDVTQIFFKADLSRIQDDLFYASGNGTGAALRVLEPLRVTQGPHSLLRREPVPRESNVTRFPSAYLAAPFTAVAKPETRHSDLLGETAPHGVLGGQYRDFLLSIERALRRLGIATIIPHRDVNGWGELQRGSSEVFKLCSEYVEKTDIFVGLLGLSHGSHYEFGLARGHGKPTLLIRVGALAESFIASGITNATPNTLIIDVATPEQVEEAITRQETRDFLERFIPVREG